MEPARAASVAASLLGLREYDFFRLAYRRWFGRQPDEKVLEHAFARFMFNGIVPEWATHLARQVLSARSAGSLDPAAFGATRYRERPSRPPYARLWVAGFVVVWLVLFLMILNARYDPGDQSPLPNCYDPSQPHPIAVITQLVTGRQLPRCDAASGSSPEPDR